MNKNILVSSLSVGLLLFLFLSSSAFCDPSSSQGNQPTVDFSYSPSAPDTSDNIQFSEESFDEDGNIVSYHWEFGDGSSSNQANPGHSFDDDGTYTVVLTVTDDDNATASYSENITVANLSPSPGFTWSPSAPPVGGTVAFNAFESSDSDGLIENYLWDFDGDRQFDDRNGTKVDWVFENKGTYEVALRTIDDDGGQTTRIKTIHVVRPYKLTAKFSHSPESPVVYETVKFNSEPSQIENVTISSFFWSFGDGENALGSKPRHFYRDSGDYEVTLTVTTDNGWVSKDKKAVSVRPIPENMVEYRSSLENLNLDNDVPSALVIENGEIQKLTVTSKESVKNVGIDVSQLENVPSEFDEGLPGTVYKSFNFSFKNITNEEISEVEIQFRISRSWMETLELKENIVRMYRFDASDQTWKEVRSEKFSQGDFYMYYKADSSGLSLFAVTVQGEEKEKGGGFPVVSIAWAVVVIALVGLFGYILRERKGETT